MTDKDPVSTAPNQEIVAHTEPANQVAAPATESGQLMNVIAQMAQDPNADITKLERLIALRNAEIAAQAKREYDAAFVEMKGHLPVVIKTHDNAQTKSKYAKMEDINKAVDPILAKFGFGSTDKILKQTETDVTMRVELRHKGGHSESLELTMPIDDKGAQGTVNKTKPHGISSTIMYIRRVGKAALIGISTGDDNDGNTETVSITVEQAAALDTRLRAISDKALPNFLKWAKLEKLTDIQAQHLKAAEKAVANMEQEAKKAKAS